MATDDAVKVLVESYKDRYEERMSQLSAEHDAELRNEVLTLAANEAVTEFCRIVGLGLKGPDGEFGDGARAELVEVLFNAAAEMY